MRSGELAVGGKRSAIGVRHLAIRPELVLRLQNSPGALARVCDLLSAERVNLIALSLEANGTLRLIVDNPVHARGVLAERHYDVEARDALVVEVGNGPGALAAVARMLAAAGFNLDYVYATVREGQPTATVVVGVPDAMRVAAAAGL